MSTKEKVLSALRQVRGDEIADFTERYMSEGLVSMQTDPEYPEVTYLIDEHESIVLATVWHGSESAVVGNDITRLHEANK